MIMTITAQSMTYSDHNTHPPHNIEDKYPQPIRRAVSEAISVKRGCFLFGKADSDIVKHIL